MQLIPIEPIGSAQLPEFASNDVASQVVAMTLSLYTRRGYEVPWICYFAAIDGEVVGTCGFAGPPSDGEAEIAYFTFPGNEGRKLATNMARELLRISREAAIRDGIQFIAHTLPEEGPSTSILRNLGFRLEGQILHPEDGTVWKWREVEAKQISPVGRNDN